MKNRIISLVLTFSLCASLLVLPAHAYDYQPEPENYWSFFGFVAEYFQNLTGQPFPTVNSMDRLVLPVTGPVVSRAYLQRLGDDYNSWFCKALRFVDFQDLNAGLFAGVKWDADNGIYRLYDDKSGRFIVDSQGNFPYYEPPADQSQDNPSLSGAQVPATPSISRNHWVGERSLANQVVLITYDSLSECVVNLNNEGYTCSIQKQTINGTTFYVIKDNGRQVYCNSLNQPFASKGETSATDIKYDYITNDNSTTIKDTQIIDMADGVLNIVNENGDKTELHIDDINFNFDDHSYTVNAYDYTYNIQNNYYEYNYYTYNITYNISNTYINYIGSTAEFVPTEYELYYELPDGRSSADLTIDEMAGMSFQFYDVINYHKSATDTYLRALYHFDGDTDDSSYFSTQGDFTWTTGASLTYMESGAFEGALYLDTAAHAFDLMLPSNIGSGDFTLQFRYYQASQPDTTSNINNYISMNGSRLMSWDESNFYYGSKDYETTLGPLSIGSWQELAIVRDSGTLYYYHNGLCVGSTSNVSVLGNVLTFNFGTTSRSYSMLDELRVLNFPLAENGASYSCTTVPYDTSVIGKATGKYESLLTFIERRTRFQVIIRVPNKEAKTTTKALERVLSKFPRGAVKTITVDNGSEFQDYEGLKALVEEVYYCHPYCSSERGSNERANRIIRRFFPKGKSMKHVTQKDCDRAAHWMNTMPRKILNYATAEELFQQELANLQTKA